MNRRAMMLQSAAVVAMAVASAPVAPIRLSPAGGAIGGNASVTINGETFPLVGDFDYRLPMSALLPDVTGRVEVSLRGSLGVDELLARMEGIDAE